MPLRVLFLDMNSFFASAEQQARPELRGLPVAVAAVDVDSTACIAASREAKRLGVRTGTPVRDARRQGVRIVEARPEYYVRVHHAIRAAVETCLPVHRTHSIDEFSCRLDPRRGEADPAPATALAGRVKRVIRDAVGPCLTCSIGLAPNALLAKIAADMRKPDGLTVLTDGDLPHALYRLHLSDVPGIGPNMLKRLYAATIFTVQDLCQQHPDRLRAVWGNVVGRQYWHWLRGEDWVQPPTRHTSVSHSHVLPPSLRTMDGARGVCVRLIHKAATRLRRMRYFAGRLGVYVSFTYREEGWSGSVALGQCQDTLTMLEAFAALWRNPPPVRDRPTQVAVTLYQLVAPAAASLPLFPAERRRLALAQTLDEVNRRHGNDTLYFAGMHALHDVAPTRIPFSRIPALDDFEVLRKFA